MSTGGAAAWWRPVWVRARASLRHRLLVSLALAAIIGLAAGVVIASVAGARRTDSAVDRFMRYYRPYDVGIVAADPTAVAEVARLPEVLDAGESLYLGVSPAPDRSANNVVPFVALDDREFRTMDRIEVVRGRMSHADDPSEVVINDAMATQRRLRVGSRFTVYSMSWEQMQASASSGSLGDAPPAGPAFEVRVTGIGRLPADLSPHGYETMLFTPAFATELTGRLGITVDDLSGLFGAHLRYLRLRAGPAGVEEFMTRAQPILGPGAQFYGPQSSDSAIAADGARRTVHLQALALLAFAGLAAVTVLFIMGQTIARQVALNGADDGALRAMGMTTGQLVMATACRTAVLAVASALAGVAIAVALSPVFPVGLARRAEVAPGIAWDLPVLLVGAVATVAFIVGRAAAAAWRPARQPTVAARPSRVADALNRAGFPAPAVAGVRMSLEAGRGRTAIPARSALTATAASVAGVLAAVTFGVSLHHLVASPRRQGWNWDVLVGNPNASGDPKELPDRLAASPSIEAVSGVTAIDPLRIDGRRVEAMALEDVKRRVTPTVLEGSSPSGPDEIALGSGTLHAIGRHVGDTVEVASADVSRHMRITGRIVVPTAGDFWSSSLSKGALVTLDAAKDLVRSVTIQPTRLFTVRFTPGTDQAAAVGDLQRQLGADLVQSHVTPQDIENLRRVAWEPFVLAALVVVIGVGALGHTLVTSIRRRRRDLAVLKTLGFVRRQVAATVAWQATALAGAAVVIGVPVGLAAGRLAWSLVAAGTGTYSPSVVSILSLLAIVPLTFAAANLLAAGPGWAAARVKPAMVLRAE